jgi:hypothetical protein
MGEPWNYLQNGQPQGPVTEEALKELLATGQLPWEGLVWHPGLPDWIKASDAPELQPARPAPAEPAPESRSPFEPPKAVVRPVPEPSSLEARAAVAGALEALRGTKPWARFLGVLGIIGVAFMFLFAILMSVLGRGPFSRMPGQLRLVLPLIYLVMGAFQIPPVVYLNRYASRIGALLESQKPEDLTRALEAQKGFWRYVGIFALVVMCLYALGIILAVGVAGFVAAGRRF